jgi:hypothetical protein
MLPASQRAQSRKLSLLPLRRVAGRLNHSRLATPATPNGMLDMGTMLQQQELGRSHGIALPLVTYAPADGAMLSDVLMRITDVCRDVVQDARVAVVSAPRIPQYIKSHKE